MDCLETTVSKWSRPYATNLTLDNIFQWVGLLPATLPEYFPECILELLCATLQQRAQFRNGTLICPEFRTLEILKCGVCAIEGRYVIAELDISQSAFDDAIFLVGIL